MEGGSANNNNNSSSNNNESNINNNNVNVVKKTHKDKAKIAAASILNLSADTPNDPPGRTWQRAMSSPSVMMNTNTALPLSRRRGIKDGAPRKKTVEDFIIGQVLGEGAYGAVVLGTDKENGAQYAIKILEKKHILKENKQKYVKTERDILCMCSHPSIVKLFFTFRSDTSLYYVLEYCCNGELLSSLRKLGSFDEECVKFYTAELVCVLEYLHSKGIVHRDLKPENILMSGDWHIKLTDFGTATILGAEKNVRSGSFVGTAEYVSPELISSKETCCSSDLWALGSIVYQMFTNRLPFRGKTEYLTIQKVSNRDIIYPKDFPPVAKDFIENLLVVDPGGRLGARAGGYAELKAHPFFEGVDWNDLPTQKSPPLRKLPYTLTFEEEPAPTPPPSPNIAIQKNPVLDIPVNREEMKKWGRFLQTDELVVFSGLIWKRKGLSIKKRHMILTDTPRLIYIDPKKMELKGEIPWSENLRPELKNSANFWVHTPKRKYILEDASNNASQWVDVIQKTMDSFEKSRR